jgi:hypothetical protein
MDPAAHQPERTGLLGDLKDARLIYLKGGLFVVLGVAATAGILLENPSWRIAAMLAIAVWAFCRAYYFAFYVIENYVDPGYRFAGLFDFARYLLRSREASPKSPGSERQGETDEERERRLADGDGPVRD